MSPEFRRANLKICVHLGLVPEDGILELIRLRIVVNDQALVVLGALIHDLTEELKGWEGRAIVLVDTFAIRHVGFSQNEDIVHVCTQGRLDAERELHGDQEEHFEPTAVHEQIANVLVVCPRVIVHAVVENQERARVELRDHAPILILHDLLHHKLLSLHEVRQDHRVVFAVNKDRRNHLLEEAVRLLCPRDHRAQRHVLVMKEQVFDQRRLARAAAADKNGNRILRNILHLELPEVHIHRTRSCHVSLPLRNENQGVFAGQSILYRSKRGI